MTRRDMTVALYRLAGSPKVELPATSPYGDIAPDDPDYAAYIWARQKGIIRSVGRMGISTRDEHAQFRRRRSRIGISVRAVWCLPACRLPHPSLVTVACRGRMNLG